MSEWKEEPRAPRERPPDPEPRDDVVARASPVRCPFCHEDVQVQAEWSACRACLARHHPACWDEGGACAACGSRDALVGRPARATGAARSAVAVALGVSLLLGGVLAMFVSAAPQPRGPGAPVAPLAPVAPRPPEVAPPREVAPPAPAPPAPHVPLRAQELQDPDTVLAHLAADQARLAEAATPGVQLALARAEPLLMSASDRGANLWDYKRGLQGLRAQRSPAAVPLLIRALQLRGEQAQWIFAHDVLRAISVLTGWTLPERNRSGLAMELAAAWERECEVLEVDLERMPALRRLVVVDLLLGDAERPLNSGSREELGAYQLDQLGRTDERRDWQPAELHPSMIPALLEEACGQRRAAAIELLIAVRRAGQLPELESLLRDPQRLPVQRLALAVVRWKADGACETALLESLARDAHVPLSERVVAVLVLGRAGAGTPVAELLVELLGDDVKDLRVAAAQAAWSCPDERVSRALVRQLQAGPRDELPGVARALARHGGAVASEPLAQALEDALARGDRQVYELLSAFSDATGHRVVEAGAHDGAYYQAKAREALAWWRRAHPR